jgi:hypothetical protein
MPDKTYPGAALLAAELPRWPGGGDYAANL